MNGILCSCKANTNEEYRKVIRSRMNRMIALFFVGIITIVIALIADHMGSKIINEHMLGVYLGVGTGLTVAAIILWIKNKMLLSDEEKLKNSRLSNTDERIQEISNKAFRVGTVVLLITLYAVGLIGGLFNPMLVEVLLGLVSVFLLSYLIAYKVYENRM